MHEQSVIKSLLAQVEQICRQHDSEQVTEVRIEVGPLTGVEPLLLLSAFDLLTPHSVAAGARLVIDKVPLLARCESCSCEFQIDDFLFCCPTCCGNVKVICGDEFHLVSVTVCETETKSCHNSCGSLSQVHRQA